MLNRIFAAAPNFPAALSSDHDPLFEYHRWKVSGITTIGRASTIRWTASRPRLRPGSQLEDQSILPNTAGNTTVEVSTSCQSLPSRNSPQTGHGSMEAS
jgi:hypothetical protein